MKELFDNPNDANLTYCNVDYLKNKLQEKYGNSIFFRDSHIKESLMCFEASVFSILIYFWYAERKSDAEEDSVRVMKIAVEMIMMELRSKVDDLKHYPSNETISDSKLNLEYLTSLLKVFLENLINNELKQIRIGQTIVHAVKPKSSLHPILFGLFVELDHVFGSKLQLTELNCLRFSLSYQEVSRYKQYVVISEDIND